MADLTVQDGANTSSTTTDNTSWWRRLLNEVSRQCTWQHVEEGLLGNDEEVREHLNPNYVSSRLHIIYCVYRVLLCVYCWVVLGCCLFSDVKLNHNVLAYLTTWTYITICLYLLLTALALIPCQSRPDYWMGQIIWWLSANIALIFSILVTSATYIFDIRKDDRWNFLNLNVHMLNTVIMVIDTIISNRPVKVFGFLSPILYGLVYVIFNVTYTFTGHLETPIYSFLDWKTNVAKAIGITCAILLSLIGINLVAFAIKEICKYCCTASSIQGPTEATPFVPSDVESDKPREQHERFSN